MVACIGLVANRKWDELLAVKIVVWTNMQLGVLKSETPSESAFAELATASDSRIDLYVEFRDSIANSDSILSRLESRVDADGRIFVIASIDVHASAERVVEAIGLMIDEGMQEGRSCMESGRLDSFDQRNEECRRDVILQVLNRIEWANVQIPETGPLPDWLLEEIDNDPEIELL